MKDRGHHFALDSIMTLHLQSKSLQEPKTIHLTSGCDSLIPALKQSKSWLVLVVFAFDLCCQSSL